MRPARFLVAVSLCLAASSGAHAADPQRPPQGPAARPASPPTDEADALFEEGRRLMDKGQLAEACAKLERSFQLAPRLGAMLNLGGCLEKRGQLARALALYERAVTLARQLGRPDREGAAREYAAALEGRVAKLVVVLEDPSFEVVAQVDGETISTRAGLVPLDPGKKRLVVRAPGRVPFEAVLDLAAGKTLTVTIPKLREEPAAAPPPSRLVASSDGGAARTLAIAAGLGVAAVGVGVGTVFGLRAKSKRDESDRECDVTGCSPLGLTLVDQAQTAGNLSTVSFVVAGAGLATSLAVVLFSSPRGLAGQALRLAPWAGGATVIGAF